MRWAQRQRLAFIGDRLRSGAVVNRSDLIRTFGISAAQAARDFRSFLKSHPGAMKYDTKSKAYVPNRMVTVATRNTTAAADRLMRADDAELETIMRHDPSMIRDVAAALIYERRAHTETLRES